MSENNANCVQGACDIELQIRIDVEHYTEYRGTRAQLETEGIVPLEFEWPEGRRWAEWTSGHVEFQIRRARPEGMRGPAKLWIEGDFWMLRIFPAGHSVDPHIKLKMRDLRRALYLQSSEGQARFHRTWEAYELARKDVRFQAFKELIPAFREVKRRRGGRPRASSAEAQRTEGRNIAGTAD